MKRPDFNAGDRFGLKYSTVVNGELVQRGQQGTIELARVKAGRWHYQVKIDGQDKSADLQESSLTKV